MPQDRLTTAPTTAAVGTAAGPPAEAGSHAVRLEGLYPADPALVSREEGLMLYRDMTLGRRFEDKCAEMYYRGKMFGFVHLYNGQDAVSTGVIRRGGPSMTGFAAPTAITFMP